MVLVVKNPSANARVVRDKRSISGSGRSPGGGNEKRKEEFHMEADA